MTNKEKKALNKRAVKNLKERIGLLCNGPKISPEKREGILHSLESRLNVSGSNKIKPYCNEMVPLSVPDPHPCGKQAVYMVVDYYTDEAVNCGRVPSKHVYLCAECLDWWVSVHKQSSKDCAIKKI